MAQADTRSASLMTPVLITGCIIILVSFAVRASFGVFQLPIAEDLGWMRADFSMAIAIQSLAWGIGQPLFGALADRIGDRRAIVIGTLMYAVGLGLSAFVTSPISMQALNGLIGFGVAGTGFGVILAVVGRASSDENRSISLAIATAAVSAGQVVGPPLAEVLLQNMHWSQVFLAFAAMTLAALVVLPWMRAPVAPKAQVGQSLGPVLLGAARDPSFTLLFLGFFSCGYQLAFITAHFPALVTELSGPIASDGILAGIGIATTSALGAISLAVIGLFNIAGTLTAGWLGNLFQRKYLLALIYTGRTVASIAFIMLPITPGSVLVFSAVMGALWLATVPLTSGLIAHLYGLRHMGTLFGVVFFSHQLGGFMGVWLGGRLYDVYGDYTAVWWLGVAVGAFSALVHLPIQEKGRSRPGLAA